MNRPWRWIRPISLSRESGLAALALALAVGFGLAVPEFRDPLNLFDRSRHWVEIGMLAVAMTFIITTAGIDLSVGSVLAMAGIVGGLCYGKLGWPLPAALLASAAIGLLGGAFNGLVISFLGVPALVVTLATMALFRGVAMGLSKAQPVSNYPEAFTDWGSFSTVVVAGHDLWVPWQTLILIAVAAGGHLVYSRTKAGRWAMQIGENNKAARFTAVPVRSTLFWLYATSGLLAGLASITWVARYATAHPAAARGLELEVIACVVIGGTRIMGGSGSVIGTFLGLLIVGFLRFGMDMIGVLQEYQVILIGGLVIAAAIFNEWMARRAERRPQLAE